MRCFVFCDDGLLGEVIDLVLDGEYCFVDLRDVVYCEVVLVFFCGIVLVGCY